MPRIQCAPLAASALLFLFTVQAQTPAANAPPVAVPVTQPPAMPPVTAAPTPAHPLDEADLTAFFDGILPLQLERSDIAGASVLVMKDGNVLLEKGSGYADMKSKNSADPNSTN